MKLTKKLTKLAEQFREYAISEVSEHKNPDGPKEACGLIIDNEKVFYCKNISPDPRWEFTIDPNDYLEASNLGEITFIIHSHVAATAKPTDADIKACNVGDIPWIIVSTYPILFPEIEVVVPKSIELPLIGREFNYQNNNCYTLIQDYFKKELNIHLNNYAPGLDPNEWLREDVNYYGENFKAEGFIEVDKSIDNIRVHDAVLMQIRSPRWPDHVGVITRIDNKIIMLHHLLGQLSCETTWQGVYSGKKTMYIVRHKSLMD